MQEYPYVGGNFNNSVNAGLRYWNCNNSPGNANINIGARHILAMLKTIAQYYPYRLVKIKSYRLDKRPLDFLGFKFYRTHVTMRKRNSLRIKRRAKKIYKNSAAILSYLGWLQHSNSYNYYLKNIKPYVNIKDMKEVVKNESRKRNQAQAVQR